MIRTSAITLLIFWSTVSSNASSFWPLPKNICNSPLSLQYTKSPTTVVGNGTPSSCHQTALAAALLKGGVIVFNCGVQPISIPINNELQVSKTNDTVIDGSGLVTLNGLGITRIMKFDRGDFRYATPTLTVQRLRFINGYCKDADGGCAILQKNGGTTVVIDSSFENNIGPTVGQDVAGGALWTIGGGDTTIVRSVFRDNKCSNGGGIGILGSGLYIYNSHFQNNQATGNGGNPGLGGNGGAISFDGRGRINSICGTRFTSNQGNKFGGAFFRVSYDGNETNNFDSVLVDSNFIPVDSNGLAGGLYIQGGGASIRNSIIANNSAGGAGGLFLADEKSVTLTGVNFWENKAYTGLGAAIYCSNPVSGSFTGLTLANNHAGAFGAAFASCGTTITISSSVIANNTVGNPWPANACTSTMAHGTNVVQSPMNKQSPASGTDSPCTNGPVTMLNSVSISLNKTTWKIQATGVQVGYVGPNVVPGL